jgi:DNA topoisomerase I-like protein
MAVRATSRESPRRPHQADDEGEYAKNQDAAAIALIIMETGLRPTDGADSVKLGHYGLVSLQGRHVKVTGNEVSLDFIGKEGVGNRAVICNPETVKFLKETMEGRGPFCSPEHWTLAVVQISSS